MLKTLFLAFILALQPQPVQVGSPPDEGETVPLQQYIEAVIDQRFQAIDQRFTYIELSTTLARDSMNERLLGMNEFRDTLKDQAARLPTREEVEKGFESTIARMDRIDLRVSELERANANTSGRFWALG